MKATIIREGKNFRYFDRNGTELQDGDIVEYRDGTLKMLYRTEQGLLGVDATNPSWIASGRAVKCQYGIYPLEDSEMQEIVKVK